MRERRSKGFGSVRERKRKDGTRAFMLKVTISGLDFVRTVSAGSKKDAAKMLPAFVAEIQSGELARKRADAKSLSEQPTLAVWSQIFLAQHVSQDPDRAATRTAYANMLRLYILPALGSHKLAEITAPMIRDTMQELYRRGRAMRTLKLAFAVLHRAFDAAIEDQILKTNPMPRFSKLRLGDAETPADSAKRHALTAPQVSALLQACGEDHSLRVFVSIMASCGLRPGEANGLRWSDVDLKAGALHVRGTAKRVSGIPGEAARVWIGKTKTASSNRTVSMGPALIALFGAERARQEAVQREILGRNPNVRELKSLLNADACVFCADPATAEGQRSPRNPASLSSQFRRATIRAGLRNISPHWLRHTAISHAIAEGTSLADVSRRAGHANPAITAAVYTHAVSDGERKAAMIGDSLLSPRLAESLASHDT